MWEEKVLTNKWRWAGHVVRMKDGRPTRRIKDWRPYVGRRRPGRPERKWKDDTVKVQQRTGLYQHKIVCHGGLVISRRPTSGK
jgi:hypothetical protein